MDNLKIVSIGVVLFFIYNGFQFLLEGGSASSVGLRLFLLIAAVFSLLFYLVIIVLRDVEEDHEPVKKPEVPERRKRSLSPLFRRRLNH